MLDDEQDTARQTFPEKICGGELNALDCIEPATTMLPSELPQQKARPLPPTLRK